MKEHAGSPAPPAAVLEPTSVKQLGRMDECALRAGCTCTAAASSSLHDAERLDTTSDTTVGGFVTTPTPEDHPFAGFLGCRSAPALTPDRRRTLTPRWSD